MSSPSSTTAEIFGNIQQLFAHQPGLQASSLAVIGLGANLPSEAGEPADTLRAVVPELQKLSSTPLLMSAIIETEPDDCPPGSPRFANAVAVICPQAGLTPLLLLDALLVLPLVSQVLSSIITHCLLCAGNRPPVAFASCLAMGGAVCPIYVS